MINKYILTVFILLSLKSYSCSCKNTDTFLETLSFTNLTAIVKVTDFLVYKNIYEEPTPMSMEVEIIEILKGKEERKKIIVWGDNGNYCRPYLSKFSKGSYYIISFNKGYDTSSLKSDLGERPTDYSISSCGTMWLKFDFNKKTAFGKIDFQTNDIKLKPLKRKINKAIEESLLYIEKDFQTIFEMTGDVLNRKEWREKRRDVLMEENLYNSLDYFKKNNDDVFNFISDNEKQIIHYRLLSFEMKNNLVEMQILNPNKIICSIILLRKSGKWKILGFKNKELYD